MVLYLVFIDLHAAPLRFYQYVLLDSVSIFIEELCRCCPSWDIFIIDLYYKMQFKPIIIITSKIADESH